jgi:hypothetical protein
MPQKTMGLYFVEFYALKDTLKEGVAGKVDTIEYAEYVADKDEKGIQSVMDEAQVHAEEMEADLGAPVYYTRYNDPDRKTVHSTESRSNG